MYLPKLPTFSRALCALSIVSIASLSTAADADSQEIPSASLVQQRLETLEARMQELEAALETAPDPLDAVAPGPGVLQTTLADVAVAEQLARLEVRMAGLERLAMANLTTHTSQAAAASPMALARNEPSETIETPIQPTVATAKGLFLPSRGYAGGVLHYGGNEQRLDFHAFLDLEYIDAEPQGSRSGVSTFDNHHANLFVRSVIRPNLLGHIEFEYEHGGDTVEIDQAFLEWASTDWLTLRAGRFYTPFGIERFVWYSPTNALVSRPAAMRNIIPGNFYANGLQASGILEPSANRRLSYELAISDGLGDDALTNRRGSRQTRDNNSSRAISGRLGYTIGNRMEFGSSIHHQRYASDSALDLTFFGLDFSGRWKGWEFRSEWLQATLETIETGGDLEQQGFYAQLGYAFHWNRDLLPELRLVSRYDEIDLDRGATGNNDQRLLSLGINMLVYDHFRTKLEYQFVSEDGPARDDDSFMLQLVLDY